MKKKKMNLNILKYLYTVLYIEKRNQDKKNELFNFFNHQKQCCMMSDTVLES